VWSRSIPLKRQASRVQCAKRSSGSMIDTWRFGYKPWGPTRQGLRQPIPPGGAHIELHYCTGAQCVEYRPISIAGTHDPTLFGQIEADIQGALALTRNMAFPASSLGTPVGVVYRFSLRCLVEVDNPCTMFRYGTGRGMIVTLLPPLLTCEQGLLACPSMEDRLYTPGSIWYSAKPRSSEPCFGCFDAHSDCKTGGGLEA
jgi:hypothetical protein